MLGLAFYEAQCVHLLQPGVVSCFFQVIFIVLFFLYFWLLTVSWFSFNTWLNSAAGIKWDRSKRRIRGSMFTSKPCSSIISALKTDCWRSWRNIKRLIEDEGWCKDSKSYITFSFSILLQIRKLLIFLVQISNFSARIFLSLINRWHLNFALYLQTFNLNILKHRIYLYWKQMKYHYLFFSLFLFQRSLGIRPEHFEINFNICVFIVGPFFADVWLFREKRNSSSWVNE